MYRVRARVGCFCQACNTKSNLGAGSSESAAFSADNGASLSIGAAMLNSKSFNLNIARFACFWLIRYTVRHQSLRVRCNAERGAREKHKSSKNHRKEQEKTRGRMEVGWEVLSEYAADDP